MDELLMKEKKKGEKLNQSITHSQQQKNSDTHKKEHLTLENTSKPKRKKDDVIVTSMKKHKTKTQKNLLEHEETPHSIEHQNNAYTRDKNKKKKNTKHIY